MEHIIETKWDGDAGVWYAVCDTIPLSLESNSFDALIERVRITATEVLAANGKNPDAGLRFIAERMDRTA